VIPVAAGHVMVDGHRLVYDEYGSGDRVVVLLHGLLMRRHMHGPLATNLAENGFRVICLDLLGHGDSDRPTDSRCYSMQIFGRHVVAVLDELGVERALIGGTSLGANVSLEVATIAPERLCGLFLDMPVLERAQLFWSFVVGPAIVLHTAGAPLLRAAGRLARLVPRSNYLADIVLDWVRQDPGPSMQVLLGLIFGRTAPPAHERRAIATRALVLAHRGEPGHLMSDAETLIGELPDARLVPARNAFELRVRPHRLTREIIAFAGDCWPGNVSSGGRAGTG
jgi:pimeloyl-ACP methyl ester carboxylesterase